MTKNQIKAELRRSALEDSSPWCQAHILALIATAEWCYEDEWTMYSTTEVWGTFFLLVAEAL